MNENASSGAYFFKSGQLMEKYFKKTIDEDNSIKGEFYVSLSYKSMIEDNLDLNIFEVKKFMQWGTPIDLKDYLWYSKLFNMKMSNKEKLKLEAILLMPAAGKGKRFLKNGYEIPKPFLTVSNKPMFIQALSLIHI